MSDKLQILVIPQDDRTYLATCNQDDFHEFFQTQILAIIAAGDHRAEKHPKEDAKVRRRSKVEGKHRRKK